MRSKQAWNWIKGAWNWAWDNPVKGVATSIVLGVVLGLSIVVFFPVDQCERATRNFHYWNSCYLDKRCIMKADGLNSMRVAKWQMKKYCPTTK